jgi:hypothetical protein
MSLWSFASTRLAFGPGRAVLIFGPAIAVVVAVMVFVVMGSSVSSRQ